MVAKGTLLVSLFFSSFFIPRSRLPPASGSHLSSPVQTLLLGITNCLAIVALLRQDKCNDEPVKTKGLGENKDENDAHKELFLLTNGTHSCVANHADRHARRQATASGM
mmetsp:Transcript_59696/g.119838  ORF Transcript_59696/g.119838 Transcript_59696/m.119838 type:complete len:109 (-) Transcript_59696:355-681(-)